MDKNHSPSPEKQQNQSSNNTFFSQGSFFGQGNFFGGGIQRKGFFGAALQSPFFQNQTNNETAQLQNDNQEQAQTDLALNGTVGDGGTNNVVDVLAVQEKLQELGYLAEADFCEEQVDVSDATCDVMIDNIPKTMAAIAQFSRMAFGRPRLVISPNDISQDFMNAEPENEIGNVAIGGTVGPDGDNHGVDVRQVQTRLHDLGYLNETDYCNEECVQNEEAIAEEDLSQTFAAIRQFNQEVAGLSTHLIRPQHLELNFLNNTPSFRKSFFDIEESVGNNGDNLPSDVQAIQERLNELNYLSDTDFANEQVDQTCEDPIETTALTQTIAALRSFSEMMNLEEQDIVEPGSELQRLLINPALPAQKDLAMESSVGLGNSRNNESDVRAIQDRLFELNYLSTEDYLAERVTVTEANGRVAHNTVPQTMSAIRQFQIVAVGANDGIISAGKKTDYTLSDPTYGTTTSINEYANNTEEGLPVDDHPDAALNRIVEAIAEHESAGGGGENPAELLNASHTPASYGAKQMIGHTAAGTIRNDANISGYYGLDQVVNEEETATFPEGVEGTRVIDEMYARASSSTRHYNAIY